MPAGSSAVLPVRRRARAGLLVAGLVLLSMVVTVTPASAAVSVSRAELSGTSLRLEGTATASRDITVDGVVMGRSDSGGRFRIERSGYTAPADCTVDVNDGSATARAATLSGCTVSTPPPPPPPPPGGPAAPTPLEPANGASVTTPVTLRWSAVIDPNPPSFSGGHNWQISASSSFASLVTADSTAPNQTQDTVGGLVAGSYFWRVQAVDGALNLSPWSVTRSFVVTGPGSGALAAPVLAPLVDGGQDHPMESFPFTWSTVPGATEYLVEASRNAAFSPVEIKIDNVEEPRNGLKIHSSLIGNWNLRVRAVGADGVVGAASNVRTFSVSYTAPIGPPPVPLSPADGATVASPFVLDWADVSNPQSSGYVVEIATDPGFDNVEALSTGLTNSQWNILGPVLRQDKVLAGPARRGRARRRRRRPSPRRRRCARSSSSGSALASVATAGSPTAYSGTEQFGEIQLTALAPPAGRRHARRRQPVRRPRARHGPGPGGAVDPALQCPLRTGDRADARDRDGDLRRVHGDDDHHGAAQRAQAAGRAARERGHRWHSGGCLRRTPRCRPAAGRGRDGDEQLTAGGAAGHGHRARRRVPAVLLGPDQPVSSPTPVTITASWRGGQVTRPLLLNPGVPPATWTLDRTTTTGSEGRQRPRVRRPGAGPSTRPSR